MKRRKDPPGYEGDAAFNWAFSEVAKQIRAASGLTDQQIVENIKKARTNAFRTELDRVAVGERKKVSEITGLILEWSVE